MSDCMAAISEIDNEPAVLACWLPAGHKGPHWDEADNLTWYKGRPYEWPADGPPEYEPDDGEAQRIADTYADAAAELARDEAGEAGHG